MKMRKERVFRRTKLVGMNFVPRVDFFPFPPPFFNSLDGPPRLPLPLAQADEQQLVRRSSSQETASARSRDSPRRE